MIKSAVKKDSTVIQTFYYVAATHPSTSTITKMLELITKGLCLADRYTLKGLDMFVSTIFQMLEDFHGLY